jgi:AcrR family transcriptional regulator
MAAPNRAVIGEHPRTVTASSEVATPTLRDQFRQQVRHRMLDVAASAAIDRGWQRVRLAEVAAESGLSRSTLFREFGGKAGLAHALMSREADRTLGEIAQVLHRACDRDSGLRDALRTAFHTRNPLLAAVLSTRHGDTSLLPLVTTRAAPILVKARGTLSAFLRPHHPRLPGPVLDEAVDTLVRATLSHLTVPELDRERAVHRLHLLACCLLDVPATGPS